MNPDLLVFFRYLLRLFLDKLVIVHILKFLICNFKLHSSPQIANDEHVANTSAENSQLSSVFFS